MAEKERGRSSSKSSGIRHQTSYSVFFAADGQKYALAPADDLIRSGIHVRTIPIRSSTLFGDYLFHLRRSTAAILICTSQALRSDIFHFFTGALTRGTHFTSAVTIVFEGSSLKDIRAYIAEIPFAAICIPFAAVCVPFATSSVSVACDWLPCIA